MSTWTYVKFDTDSAYSPKTAFDDFVSEIYEKCGIINLTKC